MDVWHQVKLHYIGLLVNHHQPELAETFFNSVTTKILHRTHFHNDFIFVRPAVSTEYIENDEPAAKPTYRAYYPTRENAARDADHASSRTSSCSAEFEDLPRDTGHVLAPCAAGATRSSCAPTSRSRCSPACSFRNKGAYVVGKIINGFTEVPFALPILHDDEGKLIDAALFGEDDLQMLFSFARAYFMVDMEVPSAYVQFLRSLMPRKPRAEIYNALGLAKQGKTLFYRDFLYHLKHSSDSSALRPASRAW
jgi:isocitrate dehydrogenase kinase/phosphatase